MAIIPLTNTLSDLSNQAAQEAQRERERNEKFQQYLQEITRGEASVEDVSINLTEYEIRGKPAARFTTSSTIKDKRYAEEGSKDIGVIGQTREEREQWAIQRTKTILGLGAEDAIRINGRVVQESSLTPEELVIAKQIQSGRMSALAEYENRRDIERRDLQSKREGAAEFQAKDTARLQALQDQTKGKTPIEIEAILKENLKGSLGKEVLETVRYNVGDTTFSKADIADQYRKELSQDYENKKAKLTSEGFEETPLHSPEGGKVWRMYEQTSEFETPIDINPATGKRWTEPLSSEQQIQLQINDLNNQKTTWERITSGMETPRGKGFSNAFYQQLVNTAIGAENIIGLGTEQYTERIGKPLKEGLHDIAPDRLEQTIIDFDKKMIEIGNINLSSSEKIKDLAILPSGFIVSSKISPYTPRLEEGYKFGRGMVKGVWEEPDVALASILIGGGIGATFKAAGATRFGQPLLAGTGKGIVSRTISTITTPTNIAGAGMLGYYGADVYSRVGAESPEAKAEKLGRITSTEILPMYVGVKIVDKLTPTKTDTSVKDATKNIEKSIDEVFKGKSEKMIEKPSTVNERMIDWGSSGFIQKELPGLTSQGRLHVERGGEFIPHAEPLSLSQSKIIAGIIGTVALTQTGRAAPSQQALDKAYEIAGMTQPERVNVKQSKGAKQSPINAVFKGDRTQAVNWGKEVVAKLKKAGIDARVDEYGNIVEKSKEWSPQMKEEKLIDVDYFNKIKEEAKKKFDKDLQAETTLEEELPGVLETKKGKATEQKTKRELVEILKGYKAIGDTEKVKLITELISKSDVSQADIEWYNIMKELPQRKFKTLATERLFEEGKTIESELSGELILDKKFVEAELLGETLVKTNEKSLKQHIQRALNAVGKVVFTGSKKTPWGFEYVEQGEPLGTPILKESGYDAYVRLIETGKRTTQPSLESYAQEPVEVLEPSIPKYLQDKGTWGFEYVNRLIKKFVSVEGYGTYLRGKIGSETTQIPKFIRVGKITDIELAKATKQVDITGFKDASTSVVTDTTMSEIFFGKDKRRVDTEITAIQEKEISKSKPITIEDVLYGDANKRIKVSERNIEQVLERKTPERKIENIILKEIEIDAPQDTPKRKRKGGKIVRGYTEEEVQQLDSLESGLIIGNIRQNFLNTHLLTLSDIDKYNIDLTNQRIKNFTDVKPKYNIKNEIVLNNLYGLGLGNSLNTFTDLFTGTKTTTKQAQKQIEQIVQDYLLKKPLKPIIDIPPFDDGGDREQPKKPKLPKIPETEPVNQQVYKQPKRSGERILYKRRINPVDINVMFPPRLQKKIKGKQINPEEYINTIFTGGNIKTKSKSKR